MLEQEYRSLQRLMEIAELRQKGIQDTHAVLDVGQRLPHQLKNRRRALHVETQSSGDDAHEPPKRCFGRVPLQVDGEHAEGLYGLASRRMLYRADLEQQGQSTERGNELIAESGLWKDGVCYWRLHGRRRVVNASSMPQRSRRQQPFCRHTVVAAAYVEAVPRWLVVGS